jgi:hypothetical protein
MMRNATQHRGELTPQDAVKLLTGEGVRAAIVWREGMRGLSIDPHSLIDALTALPDDERLPPQLEELLEVARDNSDRAAWQPLIGIAGSYLIGLPGDRRGALSMLWAAYEQWQRAKGAN